MYGTGQVRRIAAQSAIPHNTMERDCTEQEAADGRFV
jgi:hypothetical protein